MTAPLSLSVDTEPSPRLTPNRELVDGKYALIRELGSGATGLVWEAENVLVGKRVAIKLLHRQLAQNEDMRWRFVAEARAAARIAQTRRSDPFDDQRPDALGAR